MLPTSNPTLHVKTCRIVLIIDRVRSWILGKIDWCLDLDVLWRVVGFLPTFVGTTYVPIDISFLATPMLVQWTIGSFPSVLTELANLSIPKFQTPTLISIVSVNPCYQFWRALYDYSESWCYLNLFALLVDWLSGLSPIQLVDAQLGIIKVLLLTNEVASLVISNQSYALKDMCPNVRQSPVPLVVICWFDIFGTHENIKLLASYLITVEVQEVNC